MQGTQQRVSRSLARVLVAGLIWAAWLPFPATAQGEGPEALVGSFVRAWNNHDMRAFADLFAKDADFVNVAGMWWHGRAEIQARHEESHATRFKATTLSSTDTSVRSPGAGIAIIHFRWELTGQIDAKGEPVAARHGIIQMLALKQGDGWSIASAQNTDIARPR